MSIQTRAPPRRSPWQRASSDTSWPRGPHGRKTAKSSTPSTASCRLHPSPEGSGRRTQPQLPNHFQAPNSIDRSISWRLWLTGTTTRKSQLSPATRKRVRMDRSNPPHCPACGGMPAGASRARTDPARPFLNHRSYPNRCSGENRRIDTLGGALRQYVRADAGGNPGRRFLHRVSREMGVAGRRLDLAVTQQLADRRQALAQRQGT